MYEDVNKMNKETMHPLLYDEGREKKERDSSLFTGNLVSVRLDELPPPYT